MITIVRPLKTENPNAVKLQLTNTQVSGIMYCTVRGKSATQSRYNIHQNEQDRN